MNFPLPQNSSIPRFGFDRLVRPKGQPHTGQIVGMMFYSSDVARELETQPGWHYEVFPLEPETDIGFQSEDELEPV